MLLLSAPALAWTLRVNPASTPWLLAKTNALMMYIALGMVALRSTRPVAVRATAWLGALLTFAYIASVALTKLRRNSCD